MIEITVATVASLLGILVGAVLHATIGWRYERLRHLAQLRSEASVHFLVSLAESGHMTDDSGKILADLTAARNRLAIYADDRTLACLAALIRVREPLEAPPARHALVQLCAAMRHSAQRQTKASADDISQLLLGSDLPCGE